MKRCLPKFKNTPIFFRLSFIILVVFFVFLILFYINYTNFSSEKQASTFHMVNQNNLSSIMQIDDYLKDIANITKIPLTYKEKDEIYMNHLNVFHNTGKASVTFQRLNEQMFEIILAYKSNIDSCFIFSPDGKSDYKVRTPIYQPMNPVDEPWFLECINRFGKPVIIDTYELPYTANSKSPVYVFGIARGILRIETGRVIGILLANTQVSYFSEICDKMKITDGHRIIILHNSHTIYDTDMENIGIKANSILTGIDWTDTDQMIPITINGSEMLASSTYSDYSDWRIISLIPRKELLGDLINIQRSNIIFTTLIITVTLILLFAISSQIVRPIKRLVILMKLIENGDFDTQIQISSKDEIGILSESFNSMTQKINSLIHEVYLDKITQSELELQMLQSQINPHFLYNTLESISMMATINDDDLTSEMAADLGSILRYSISNYDQIVSIQDEILHLKKYIALQEIRFKSIYTIEVDIDLSFYSIPIPKMILQPAVENAIYHGMSTIRSDGKILVTALKPKKNILEFHIIDNGAGMTDEQVQSLNGYINDENTFFHSIGLRNVNKRIKLRYGEEYGLFIQSQQNIGTTVIIMIPI